MSKTEKPFDMGDRAREDWNEGLRQASARIGTPESSEARTARIASELVKLPDGMLRLMVREATDVAREEGPEDARILPRGLTISKGSKEDLAQALAPILARLDFLRNPGEG